MDTRTLKPGASAYPSSLLDLPAPPDPLFVRGALANGPAVGIVGTRRADPDALGFTIELSRALAEAGLGVVSGGALGIDGAAHRGALDAGGYTLVVQAAPLAKPYPRSHRALFDDILEAGGGWVSETPADEAPRKGRFLARNRLIAALGAALVVVQAPARSGALSTARWSVRLGRPTFAVPASPWDPRGAGNVELLRRGARVCRDARDVAEALAIALDAPPADVRPAEPPPGSDQRAVWDALGTRPAHADIICARAGLAPSFVQTALLDLAVAGLARREGGGWRRA